MVDLGGRYFEARNLPTLPFVLRHGDVLQWAALMADRRLTFAATPPPRAGNISWLTGVFRAVGNEDGLDLPGRRRVKTE